MLANFKKIGVAAAVATAIGASGAAQAIVLGEPGGALLVPHVVYDSKAQVNTMIGVTVGDAVPAGQFPTVQGTGSECSSSGSKQLHWYFFSTKSVHLADGFVKISCNDFSRFDWGYVITNPNRPFPSLDGVSGYLVLSSNDARSDSVASNYTLYGSAYLIQGDWASEAYIPVLPLRDAVGSGDEVTYKGGIPSDVNPLLAGIPLAYSNSVAARFSLRYFVDPTPLNGSTRFVLWFPDNSGETHGNGKIDRSAVAIDVYDADEIAVSSTLSLPNELNIIDASKIDGTTNNPGSHAIPDLASGQPALNSGFVLFHLADTSNTLTGPQYSRAGISFSLIGLGTSANSVQVQTDLAHERGIVPSF
ncbi:MAG: hypothetical protein P9E24_13840 [Candidatus Competibacter sp.]|nr:hypothetical protein [Candidatus Competibacter sp.]MDG4584070.1 hypothetical protein [Candidatus Competibacter sp.]